MFQEFKMSKVCQVTGKKPGFGKQLSHSHRRTNRRWNPNVQRKRYWLPSEKRWITLNVSTKGIKTIDKRGIESVVAMMRRQGQKVWNMGSDKRPIIKLRSTAGTGYTYVTTKNKTNTRERIELKKYDPVVRKHVLFKEER